MLAMVMVRHIIFGKNKKIYIFFLKIGIDKFKDVCNNNILNGALAQQVRAEES